MVNEDSILAIKIFDMKKLKKKDQGLLGVMNIRVGNVIDLTIPCDGAINPTSPYSPNEQRYQLC
jgi:hypothetical protein